MDVTINGLKERNEPAKNGTNGHAINDLQYKHISERLEQIRDYLEQEIEDKQKTIEEQRLEIDRLKNEINQRTSALINVQEQLEHSTQSTEGHRQLINKLLNDITHYQNDIDWYKRTYERRSIWGVMKEKLSRKK